VLVAVPTIVVGGPQLLTITLPLTARLTDAVGRPIPGQVVDFSGSGTSICTAMTNADGVASCDPGVLGLVYLIGSAGFDATYAGSPAFAASTAHAQLLQFVPLAL
jgi:hypothetical protein